MEIPVVICDDNTYVLNRLEKMLNISTALLQENDKLDQVFLKIMKMNNYEETVSYIQKNRIEYGLYFLDIELSDKGDEPTGIDLAEKIKLLDKHAKIIFVTNYQNMAYLTYQRRIGAVDYIIKSLDSVDMQQRLNITLQNIISNYSQQEKMIKKFTYHLGSRIINIDFNKVYYLETAEISHKLNLVKESGISFINGNLSNFENNNPGMLRISQSCLINPQNIAQIDIATNSVIFPNGDQIKYSRKMRHVMHNLKMTK